MAKRAERVETLNQESIKRARETITGEKAENKQLMSIYYLPDTKLDAVTYIDKFNSHKN